MKSIVILVLLFVGFSIGALAQGTDSSVTATVWQGTLQWQGQAEPTHFYLMMKSDSSALLVSFDNDRVVKDKPTWQVNNDTLTVLFSNGTVHMDAGNSSSNLTGTCTNDANGATGSWTAAVQPTMTESSLNQLIVNASKKK